MNPDDETEEEYQPNPWEEHPGGYWSEDIFERKVQDDGTIGDVLKQKPPAPTDPNAPTQEDVRRRLTESFTGTDANGHHWVNGKQVKVAPDATGTAKGAPKAAAPVPLTAGAQGRIEVVAANLNVPAAKVPAAAKKNPTGVGARLALAWSRTPDGPDRAALGAYIAAHVPGARPVHAAGDRVPFDGVTHNAAVGVSTGAPVEVTRPGWEVVRPDGPSVVLLPAEVRPASKTESLSEDVGVTEDGAVWFSESFAARLSEAGRAGLTLKTVTDKNGHQTKRWVRTGTATGADNHATPGGTHGPDHVVSRALRDPASLSAADVTALADHAAGLDKEQLRQLNLAFRQKIGGTKAELANRLVAHVRGNAGGVLPPPPPTPPTVPTLDLKQQDPNHPVAKAIAADTEAVRIASAFTHAFGERSKLAAEYYTHANAYRDATGAAWKAHRAYGEALRKKRSAKFTGQLKAEADRLRTETDKLKELRDRSQAARTNLREDAHKRLAELIAPKNPAKMETDATAHITHPDQQKALDDAHAFVNSVTNWPGGGNYNTARVAGGRACHYTGYNGNSGTVVLGDEFVSIANPGLYSREYYTRRATQTQVHEIGHDIEEAKPGVKGRVSEFLKYRVGNETPIDLKTQFPGSNYDPGEMGRKDNFDRVWPDSSAYYVGKDYGSFGTEIVSMGLEKLHEDPTRLATEDPEYFTFLVGVLRS